MLYCSKANWITHCIFSCQIDCWRYYYSIFVDKGKDLYSRKDTNLVFSRFISRGEVLCYNGNSATTEQKLIHSFWNALRIRRKINQLHQSSCYTSSIYYTTQNKPWICRYRFNGNLFLIFSVSPLIHVKLKKSTVEFHTFKNILKMIKQSNQSRQVLFYISNTL